MRGRPWLTACCALALTGLLLTACGGEEELDEETVQSVQQASTYTSYWKLLDSGGAGSLCGGAGPYVAAEDINRPCDTVGQVAWGYRNVYYTSSGYFCFWWKAKCVMAWGCGGKMATIVGSNAADALTGTDGDDVIVGLDGNDTIYAGGGNDLICGDGGNDKLHGEAGNDRLFGLAGSDALLGGAGTDTCNGGGPETGDTAFSCENVVNVP